MPRKALALQPTYGYVQPGHDAYMPSEQLRRMIGGDDPGVMVPTGENLYQRYWSFHGIPTTVALPDNCFAKSLASFVDHTTEGQFREYLRECAEHKVYRPGGYADVFHEHFKSPRVPWSINALFAPCLAGGWQQAIAPGVHSGTYYKYDMRSAYLWAATLGLPDTKTYTRSLRPLYENQEGLFRVVLQEPSPGAPSPYNVCRECIATNLEIETYNLKVQEVVDGVVWSRTIPGDSIVNAVRKTSAWKQAARAYWGRWGQMQKLTCVSAHKTWRLPNFALNVPWAHLIISRVKMRLWEMSKDAVHVYVDSVITPHKIPTGPDVGQWRLENEYDGIFIRGPGQYGALNKPLEKMAGVPKGSPSRAGVYSQQLT